MPNTWILVADGARARILDRPKKLGPITEIQSLANPGARLHDSELTTDAPGRSSRHGVGQQASAKEHEAENFARDLAHRLDAGRNHGSCRNIVLVAPPQFLGMLRKNLSGPCASMVTAEFAKDLSRASIAQITELLDA
jgi:protein required for attachment to host cells